MRWVFLVVGFGVGLVLGLALSYREAPRVLRSHVPVIKHVEHAPDSARREEPPTSPRSCCARRAEAVSSVPPRRGLRAVAHAERRDPIGFEPVCLLAEVGR